MSLRRTRKPPDARTEVLDRIQAALREPGEGDGHARLRAATPSRAYRSSGEHPPGAAELVELLVDRLIDYRAVVHEVATAQEVPDVLTRLLTGVRSAVVPAWLDATWISAATAAGVRLVTDVPTVPLRAEALDSVDAVLTACRVAIAETGTIVLDGAPDQGRRIITLVPDRHVCVVRADQVVQTVPEAIRVLERAPTRPQTWISGPSATSDIELTRVEGVHGPRTLEVVVVRGG